MEYIKVQCVTCKKQYSRPTGLGRVWNKGQCVQCAGRNDVKYSFAMRLDELKEGQEPIRMSNEDLAMSITALTNVPIDGRQIHEYENGLREPRLNKLVAIARFFGVSTDYLLGLEDFY